MMEDEQVETCSNVTVYEGWNIRCFRRPNHDAEHRAKARNGMWVQWDDLNPQEVKVILNDAGDRLHEAEWHTSDDDLQAAAGWFEKNTQHVRDDEDTLCGAEHVVRYDGDGGPIHVTCEEKKGHEQDGRRHRATLNMSW